MPYSWLQRGACVKASHHSPQASFMYFTFGSLLKVRWMWIVEFVHTFGSLLAFLNFVGCELFIPCFNFLLGVILEFHALLCIHAYSSQARCEGLVPRLAWNSPIHTLARGAELRLRSAFAVDAPLISGVTFLFAYSNTRSRSSLRIARHVWATEFTYFDVGSLCSCSCCGRRLLCTPGTSFNR